MKKFESSQRFLAIFLALFMLVGMFPMLPSVQVAAEGEEEVTGGDNWDETIPQDNPNYWKFPDNAQVEDDSIGGLRLSMPIFLGVEKEKPVKLEIVWETRWGTLGPDYQWLHLKVDSRIADKVDRIEAINPDLKIRVAFEPLNDPAQPHVWRCRIIDQGAKKRGMIKPGFLEITTNRSVPIEVILKDDVPFEDIDDSDYIFQTRIIKNGKYWVNKGEHTFASYANVSTSGAGLPPASDKYNYANQSQMIVNYDPVKQVLRVFHMAAHTKLKNSDNPGPSYVQIIPGDIYDLLADSGTVGKLYKVDRFYKNASGSPETYFTKDDFSQVGIEGDPGRHHVLKVVTPKYYDKTPASQTSTYRDAQWKKFVVTGGPALNTIIHSGSSEHPEGICLELNIDPASFAHLFKKQVGADGNAESELITYPFLGFYMWPDSDGTEYRYLNTYANSTLMLGKTFYVPKIREIYTDDTRIEGSIKYNVGTVYLSLPTQNDSLVMDINDSDATKEEYGYEFDIPAGQQLKKDMKVSVSNVDKRNPNRVFSPSDSVIARVKARVTFDLNGVADVIGFPVQSGQYELVAPANPDGFFYGETGYVPNGMGETMPNDPERPASKQSKFMGWNTKQDGSGETFTADTPIDESLTVYAQWEDSYKVIFVTPDGQDDIVKTYPVGTVPGAADFPILNVDDDRVFAGWYVSEEEDAQKIDENSAYADLEGNFKTVGEEGRVLTLYPHFDQKPRFQVHYYEYKPMDSDTLVHVGTKTAAEFNTLAGNVLNIKDYSEAVLADKLLEDAVPPTQYNTGYTLDQFKQIQDVDSDLQPVDLSPSSDELKSFDSLSAGQGIYNEQNAKDAGGLLHIMVILKPRTFEPTYYQVFDDGLGTSVPKQLIEAEKEQQYNLPETYSYQDLPVALPIIEVEGYRFLGWRHTTAQESEDYPRAEITPDYFSLTHVIDYVGREADRRVELTAGYEKIYDILYLDSGTLETFNLPQDFTESSTDQIVLPGTLSESAPTKTGYVFAGWQYKFSDETDFKVVASETETVTLDLAQMDLSAHQGNLEIRGRWEPTLELLADPQAEPVSIYDKDETGIIAENKNGVILSVPIPPGTTVEEGTDPLTVTISYEYLNDQKVPTPHTEEITVTAEHVKEGGIVLALPHGEAIPSAGHDEAQPDGNEQNISVRFKSGNKEKEYKISYVAKLQYMTAAYTDLMELKYGFSPTVGNYAVPEGEPISGEKGDAVDQHLQQGYELLNSRLDPAATHSATQDELDRWVLAVENLPKITDMPSLSEKTTANGTTVITVTPGENTNLDPTDVIQVFKLEPTADDPEHKVQITEFTTDYSEPGSVKLDLGNALPDGTILLVQLQDKDPAGDKLPSKLAEVVVTIDRSKANEASENTPQDLRGLTEEAIGKLADQESQDIANAYNALQEALEQKDPGPSQGEIDGLTKALNDAIDKKTQADKDAAAQKAVDELVAVVKTDDYDAKKQEAEEKLRTLEDGALKDALRQVVDAAEETQQANLNPTAENIAAAEKAIAAIPEEQGHNQDALQKKLPKGLETELPASGTDESRNWKIVWNYPGDIPEGITGQLVFQNTADLDDQSKALLGKFSNLFTDDRIIAQTITAADGAAELAMPLTAAFTAPDEGSPDAAAYAQLMKLTRDPKYTRFEVSGLDNELYTATTVSDTEAAFNRRSFVLIVDQIPNTLVDVKWKTAEGAERPDNFKLNFTAGEVQEDQIVDTRDHQFGYRTDQEHSTLGGVGTLKREKLPKIPQSGASPTLSLTADLANNQDYKAIISYDSVKGGYVVLSDAPKRYADRNLEIRGDGTDANPPSDAYANADLESKAALNQALNALNEYLTQDHTQADDTRPVVAEIDRLFQAVEDAYNNLNSQYPDVMKAADYPGLTSPPAGYVTLRYELGTDDQDYKFTDETADCAAYYIKKGTVGAGNEAISAPVIDTPAGILFTDWNQDLPGTIEADLTLTATYAKDDDIKTEATDEYIHVTFVNTDPLAGNFLDGEAKEYWVNPNAQPEVSLEAMNRPDGVVKPGWKFIGWATTADGNPIPREAMSTTSIKALAGDSNDLTLYARYAPLNNVIAADDPMVPKPKGYWTLEYTVAADEKDRGSVVAPKKWYVKPGYELNVTPAVEGDATIQEPKTEAAIGYVFETWSQTLPEGYQFTGDVTITGTFKELGSYFIPESDEELPPPGYIALTFVVDETKGSISAESGKRDRYFVNVMKNVQLGQITKPEVVNSVNDWRFVAWDREDTEILTVDTTVNAQFVPSEAAKYVPVVETILKDVAGEVTGDALKITEEEAEKAITNLPKDPKPTLEVVTQAKPDPEKPGQYKPAKVKLTFSDGSTEMIEIPVRPSQASQQTVELPQDKLAVTDATALTSDEKIAVENAIKELNPDIFEGPTPATLTVADDGETTITYPDGSKKVIPGTDLVIQRTAAPKATVENIAADNEAADNGQTKVTVTADPTFTVGEVITVSYPDPSKPGATKTHTKTVEANADQTIALGNEIPNGTVLTVTRQKPDEAESEAVQLTVKVDTSKVQPALNETPDNLQAKSQNEVNKIADPDDRAVAQAYLDLEKLMLKKDKTQKEIDEAVSKLKQAIDNKKAQDKTKPVTDTPEVAAVAPDDSSKDIVISNVDPKADTIEITDDDGNLLISLKKDEDGKWNVSPEFADYTVVPNGTVVIKPNPKAQKELDDKTIKATVKNSKALPNPPGDEGKTSRPVSYDAFVNVIEDPQTEGPEEGYVRITFNANTGAFSDGTTVKTFDVLIGRSLGEKLPTATKAEHDFKHWSDTETGDEAIKQDTVLTAGDKNKTYYAVWKLDHATYAAIRAAVDALVEGSDGSADDYAALKTAAEEAIGKLPADDPLIDELNQVVAAADAVQAAVRDPKQANIDAANAEIEKIKAAAQHTNKKTLTDKVPKTSSEQAAAQKAVDDLVDKVGTEDFDPTAAQTAVDKLAQDDPLRDELQKVIDAAKATDDAVKDSTDEKIKAAEEATGKVPKEQKANKDKLDEHIDKLNAQAAVDALVNGSDGSAKDYADLKTAAEEAINKLPVGDPLIAELNQVVAAADAVQTAVRDPKQANIDTANTLIADITAAAQADNKQTLTNKVPKTSSEQTAAQKAVDDLVDKVGTEDFDPTAAEEALKELADNDPLKEELQKVIDAAKATDEAVKDPTDENIKAAEEKVGKVPAKQKDNKDKLDEHIDKLKAQAAVDALVNGSDGSAENYETLRAAAEEAIGKLPAGDPLIEELNQVVAAADAVQAAVRDPKQANIDAANAEIEKIKAAAQADNKQTLTNKVPKTSSEQTAAQKAVDDLVYQVGTEDFDPTAAEEALKELASDDPLKEELQKVIDAAKATDEAVKDPTDEKIKAAEEATKDIPVKQQDNKDKLDEHIDKLKAQAAVDALVNGSDGSAEDYATLKTAAEEAIGKLPAGDPLIEELNQVVAAADAVQAAVRDPKQANIDAANNAIEAIPTEGVNPAAQQANQQTLTNKVPKTSSEQTAAQEAVDDLVDQVGTEDFDPTAAEEALKKLASDDPLKEELQKVIDAAKATDEAVKDPTDEKIKAAEEATKDIPAKQQDNKDKLDEHIDKLKAQAAVDALVNGSDGSAEDYATLKTAAEEAIGKLPAGDPLIAELNQVVAAADAVQAAVRDPKQANIDTANTLIADIEAAAQADNKQTLTNKVPKTSSEQTAAQKAVDDLVDQVGTEDFDPTAAEEALNNLVDGDPLKEELQKVIDAAKATDDAVKDPTAEKIKTAEEAVGKVPAKQKDNKDKLDEHINKLNAQAAVDALVNGSDGSAENYETLRAAAEEAIGKLPAGDPLIEELNQVVAAADAVQAAVRDPKQANIDAANNAIEAIPTEGVNPAAQQANQQTLTNKVPKTSSEQTAAQEAVDDLVDKVGTEDFDPTAAEEALKELASDDPLKEELQKVIDAAKATDEAVKDPTDEKIKAAEEATKDIPAKQQDNKDKLNEHIDKLNAQAEVNALVDKVGTEDFDSTAAEEALKELPDNDPLKEELRKVIDAAKATDEAVKDPSAKNIEKAEDAIGAIPTDGANPEAQQENQSKLTQKVPATSNEQAAQDAVNALVEKVGQEGFDPNAAQTAVNKLDQDDPLRDELQKVIDAAQATDTAVKTPTQANIDAANKAIQDIPTEGVNPAAQQANQQTLTDKVPTTSSEQAAAQKAVNELVDKVGTEDFDPTAAEEVLEKLADNDPLRDELQKVIDAAKATDEAVKDPSAKNIEKAEDAIGEIPTDGANPDAQQENQSKLTQKVPVTSNEQAAQDAVNALVEEVGQEGFDPNAAQTAVNKLDQDDPLRDELQKVIDAAKATDDAVRDPSAENIKAAEDAIGVIPTDGVNPAAQQANKQTLTDKVPTTSSEQAAAQAAVDALVEGSDGSAEDYAALKAAAEEAINNLAKDDPLVEELQKVVAAADAVQAAVRDPKQEKIDKANAEIAKITGNAQDDNKATLTGKVPTESTEDKQAAAQKAVNELVDKVGTEDFDPTTAEEALEKLADNDPLKNELRKVIDAAKATDAAAKDPTDTNIKAAEDAIGKIPTGGVNPGDQNANQNKLNEKMPTAQDVVDAYVEAVTNQNENTEEYKKAADKKVEGAPEDDPLKKVVEAADLVDSTLKETNPDEPKDTDADYVSEAQAAIDKITEPEQQKNKQALQEALDARKRNLDIWLINCMQTFDASGATAAVKPLLTTRKSYDVTLSAADAAKTRLDSDGNYYLVEVPYNFKGTRNDWELSVRARESAADECIKVQGIVEYADKLDADLTHNVYSIESVANLVSKLDGYTKVVNQEDYQNLLATIERVKNASTVNAVEQVDVRVTFEKDPDGSNSSVGNPMDDFAALVEIYNATPFYLRAADGSVQTYEGLKRQAEDMAVQFNRFLANPESYFRVALTDNNTFDLNDLTEVTYIEVEDGIEVEKVAQALEVEFDLYFRDSLMDTITLAIAIFDETGEEATEDEAISEIEQMLMDEVYNLIELYAADFPVDEQMAQVEELLGKLADDNQVKIDMQAVLEAFELVKLALEDTTTLNVIAAEQAVQQLSAESQADMQSTLDYIRPKEGREEVEVKAEIVNLVNNLNTERYEAVLLRVRELLESIPEDRPMAQKVNAVIRAVEAVRSAAANVNEETVSAAANSIQDIDAELFGDLKDVLASYLDGITGNRAEESESTESTEVTEDPETTEVSETTETTVNTEPTEDPKATESPEGTEVSEPTEGTEVTEDTEPTETSEPTENAEPTEDPESAEDSEATEEPADTAGGAGKKRIITMVLTSNSEDKPIEVKVPFLILPRVTPTPEPDPTTPDTEVEEPDDTPDMADLYDPQPPVPPIPVRNRSRLALQEKARVEAAIRDANPNLPAGTMILIGDDGTATIIYPDGSSDVIPGELNVVEIEHAGIYIPPFRLPSETAVDAKTKQTEDAEKQVDAATAPGAPTVVTSIPATGEDIAVPLTLGFSLLALAVALLIYRRRH